MVFRALLLVLILAVIPACSGSDSASADFEIAVGSETFVLRSTNPETIMVLREALQGRRSGHPNGPLALGNGGFNAPWSWHLDPSETRFVEASIEVCDGAPSYVEAHKTEFPRYCPWSARVTREMR
jgi:hypothetical protein